MTRRVCLLGPTDSRSTLRTLVRQMSLLWKFDLHEIDCSGAPVTVPDGSPILVELAAGDEAYQETIAGLVQYSTRCILFATSAVSLGPRLGAVSGVRRVEWRPYTADAGVRCLAEDPLLHGICDTVRLLHFKGSAAGHIECDGATVLLEAETRENLLTRKGDCYTIAIPVSQFGIVSFPAFFRLLENALFFADELPHISPGPYVSFRIDDLPVTGESILKRGYADWMGSAEIRAIQSVARDYGARIEYMLSSHTVTASGVLRSAAETAPRAFRMIGRLFRDGEINLGVHGRAHLDLEVYGRERAIEPREFQFMDAERTRITLEGLAEWMRAEFGKCVPALSRPPGDTAPA